MVTRFASFPIARSASPSVQGSTSNVQAPPNDGSNTNLLVDPIDSTRSYIIIRNNSADQIVYGYSDLANLDVDGMVLNPSDSAVLTVKGNPIYIRSLNVVNATDVRIDKGTA